MESLYNWLKWPTNGSDNPRILLGKVALVTGATSGIGKEVARDLANRGARVLMLCRDLYRADILAKEINNATRYNALTIYSVLGRLDKGHVEVYQVDLSSLASVKKCSQEILEKETRIDLLVNNAGVMMCPYEKTVDGFEKQFATNHLGHFLLNELLMPLVYKAARMSKDKARIVITSSVAHKFGSIRWHDLNSTQSYNAGSAYAQSKLANVLYANALARKLQDENISVYSVHPGVVLTDLFRYWTDNTIIKWTMPLAQPFMKTPWHGAQTTLYCLLDDKIENQTGFYYEDCKPGVASEAAKNVDNQDRLWQISMEMINKVDF